MSYNELFDQLECPILIFTSGNYTKQTIFDISSCSSAAMNCRVDCFYIRLESDWENCGTLMVVLSVPC